MSESPTATLRRIKWIKGLFGALCLACAALSAKLLPDRLIPQQLGVITTIGGLLILLCLVISLVYWSSLHRHLRTSIIISLLGIILLFYLQIFFVATVENYGNPPATHHFLVGYELTDYGRSLRNELSPVPLAEEEYIREIGYDQIPLMYGNSYYVIVVAYSAVYLVFIPSVIFVFASLMASGSENSQESEQGERPPKANTAGEKRKREGRRSSRGKRKDSESNEK